LLRIATTDSLPQNIGARGVRYAQSIQPTNNPDDRNAA